MSKRKNEEEDDYIVKEDDPEYHLKRYIITHVKGRSDHLPPRSELEYITNLLVERLKSGNLYDEFLETLSKSRYAPFMMSGVHGERVRKHYRPFYEDLIQFELIRQYIDMYIIVKHTEPNYYVELMSDIYNKFVFTQGLIDRIFLGHYITHTQTTARVGLGARERQYVIKNIDNKRLLCYFRNNGAEYPFRIENMEFVSLAGRTEYSNPGALCALGFNNDLYSMDDYWKWTPITQFNDGDGNLFDYNMKGIRIKALYSSYYSVYLITSNGDLYVNKNNWFTPVKYSFDYRIVVVHLIELNDDVILILDENNHIYVLDDVNEPFQDIDSLPDQEDIDSYIADVNRIQTHRRPSDKGGILLQTNGYIELYQNKVIKVGFRRTGFVPMDFPASSFDQFMSPMNKVLMFTWKDIKELSLFMSDQNVYDFRYSSVRDKKKGVIREKVFRMDWIYVNKATTSVYAPFKPSEKEGVFQCHYCSQFDKKLWLDQAIDGKFCDNVCQSEYYVKKGREITRTGL